jgi:outer membrane protein OmpA-like peptidoglycan-associated protein
MFLSTMFRFILTFGCLLYGFSSCAQLTTYIHDDFADNRLLWATEHTPTHSTYIENGQFVFEKTNDHGRFVTQHQFIDPTKDFSLQADFINHTPESNGTVGLVWGHSYIQGKGNWFLISGSSFSIQAHEPGRTDVGHWHPAPVVAGAGKVNSLRVEHRSDSICFFVNGHEVHQIPTLTLHDLHFGIMSFVRGRVSIDNFVLKSATKINLADETHHGIVKENLGQAVNSAFAEVHPQISADGHTLFFGRKSSPENVGGEKDLQDIWTATSEDGEAWSKAVNIREINSTTGDNLIAVSPDNNTLTFFYYSGNHKTFGTRRRTATGWSELKPLPIEIENESIYLESCVSPDGKVILFTARNPRNLYYHPKHEERDIYVCIKQGLNQWSSPLNLGNKINTSGNEFSPFLAADGRTLYFATDGLAGYGNVDIFMTQRLDDTWTNWTAPVNLGPEINSNVFDAYYTIPASGHSAYMVSSLNSLGHTDIVKIKIPESIQPDPVVLVSGKTLHAKTREPVTADIIIEDLGSQKHAGEATSNISTGTYSIILPYGKNYGFHAYAKGYLSVNENLELAEIKRYTELNKDLLLVPLEKGESIPLNNVFFERGKPQLRAESFPELDRLIQILRDNPSMEIELAGYTDNVGYRPSLIVLSQERASTVKAYLVKNGIASQRIRGKGYGPAKPLVANDSEENRMKNRRVEVKIRKL